MITIDGSYGEGGGQVLRTSLTLAILTGRTLQVQQIRAGRSKPGLAAQHLTAVRAAAAICDAKVDGDQLGSTEILFQPGGPARPGTYAFDIAEMRQGGSAGSVSLVFQTIFLPLAMAEGSSQLTLRGGTHVAWSPPFPYLEQVYLATLAPAGLQASLELRQWGFYPAGGGEMVAQVPGGAASLQPLTLTRQPPLERMWGTAAVSNLPSHIPQRMANRARNLLAEEGLALDVQARRERGAGPGAGIFIIVEHEGGMRSGFSAYGRKGLPAEQVAEAACRDLLIHLESNAPVDRHLADQLILPLSMAEGISQFTTCQVTEHLRTNTWVVEQFGLARFEMRDAIVTVIPSGHKT